MMSVPLLPVSLLLHLLFVSLLLPTENEGSQTRNTSSRHPPKPRVSGIRMSSECEAFCQKWGVDNFKEEHKTEEFEIPCLDYNPDPDPTNPDYGICSYPSSKWNCPKACDYECKHVFGHLKCDALPENLWPTLPQSCLKYCQDPDRMPPDLTFDTPEYQIDCGYELSSDTCGYKCPDCPGPVQGNKFCDAGRDNLKCPGPLDPSVLPQPCNHFCAEEAWRKGLTKADGTFSVVCGLYPQSHYIKRVCGQECPSECNGFCVNLDLHCPAVDPVKPTTTTSTEEVPHKGKEVSAASGGRDKPEDGDDSDPLMISLIVVGVLIALLVCGLLIWWWRRSLRGGGSASKAPPPPNQASMSSESTLQPRHLPQNPQAPPAQGFPAQQQVYQVPQNSGFAQPTSGMAPGAAAVASGPPPVSPMAQGVAYPVGQAAAYPAAQGAGYPVAQSAAYPMAQGTAYPVGQAAAYPVANGAAYPVGLAAAYPGAQGAAYQMAPGGMPQVPPGGIINPNATLLTQKYARPNFPTVAERLQQAYPRPAQAQPQANPQAPAQPAAQVQPPVAPGTTPYQPNLPNSTQY